MSYQPKAETATANMPPVAPAVTPTPAFPDYSQTAAPVYQQPEAPVETAPVQPTRTAPAYPSPPTGAPGWQAPTTTGAPVRPGPRYY